MRIIEKQPGAHVDYCLEGTRIVFRGGELALDLARYVRDYPVHLIVSENEYGMLVLGPAHRYVAELDLPARVYTVEKGEADDIGFPRLYRHPVPFDLSSASLTLWAMEG